MQHVLLDTATSACSPLQPTPSCYYCYRNRCYCSCFCDDGDNNCCDYDDFEPRPLNYPVIYPKYPLLRAIRTLLKSPCGSWKKLLVSAVLPLP